MPPNPNELTPASGGPLVRGPRTRPSSARESEARRKVYEDWAPGSAGSPESPRCWSASATLISPAMPAAASQMADIGLDRTDRARVAPAHDRSASTAAQRLRLDRIAQQSAGAVRLDVLNVAG